MAKPQNRKAIRFRFRIFAHDCVMANNKNLVSRIYREYCNELRKFLFSRLRCSEDAADVVQDAFVRVLMLGDDYEIQHPRGLLYRTALNLTVDRLRSRSARPDCTADFALAEDLAAEEPDPESVLDMQQRLQILQEAIAELPPKCRTVFMMHKFENLSYNEISASLGISRNMVEKHIIKALAYCRKRLDELD